MDETRLTLDQYSIGKKSTGGGPGQPEKTRANVEAIGEMIVGIITEGVGSSESAGRTAQLALDIIFTSLRESKDKPGGIQEKIAAAVNAAHTAILQQGGGTGLSSLGLAVIWNDHLYSGSTGGSQVYLVSETGTLAPLGQNYPDNPLYGEEPSASLDHKQAFWMGTAELALKPGETVLLCSDGLVKKSRAGREYVRKQELIESVQSNKAPGAAHKIVQYAQGRHVNEAVAVVVIQHLAAERITEVLGDLQVEERSRFVWRRALIVGMGALAIIWTLLMSRMLNSEIPPAAPEVVKNNINISQAPSGEKFSLNPAKVMVDDEEMPVFGTISGPGGTVDRVIYTGTTLTTQETGQRVVIGVPKGSLSIVYLFANTQAQINFADQVLVMLYQGYVYVQPGVGPVEVHLPQFQDAVARVQGSRMIVRVLNSTEVEVLCFEGKCDFRYPGRSELVAISVGSKRTFNMANGVAGPEVPMSYAEMLAVDKACDYCVTALIPTPTTPATATSIPTVGIFLPTPTLVEILAASRSNSQPSVIQPAEQPVLQPTILPTQPIPTLNAPKIIPPTQQPPKPDPTKEPKVNPDPTKEPKVKPDPGPKKPKPDPCKPNKNRSCP